MTVFESLDSPEIQNLLGTFSEIIRGEVITKLLYTGLSVTLESIQIILNNDVDVAVSNEQEKERYAAAKLGCMLYLAKKQTDAEIEKQNQIIRQYQL